MHLEDGLLQVLIGRRRRSGVRWGAEVLRDFGRQMFIGKVKHLGLVGDATTLELSVQLIEPVSGSVGRKGWDGVGEKIVAWGLRGWVLGK